VSFGESVEQTDADGERELLASDRVHEALEEGGKPRRLQPAEACGECLQEGVARGEAIELGEIELEPEQAREGGSGRFFGLLVELSAGKCDGELWDGR
jgi:hypothetical protein